MFKRQLEMAGILTPEQNRRMINDAPFDDAQRKFLDDTYKQFETRKEEE